MPSSSIDFSWMRVMISCHFSGVCATLLGTFRMEPTLYLLMTLSSLASSICQPFCASMPWTRMYICIIISWESVPFERSNSLSMPYFFSIFLMAFTSGFFGSMPSKGLTRF